MIVSAANPQLTQTAPTPEAPESQAPGAGSRPAGNFRWKICALIFFATTLNYMDRQVLALLKPTLADPVHGIGLTEVQFAAIVSVFSAAYALGLLLAGRYVDKVGTRIGYAVAVSIWTLASVSHSLAGIHSPPARCTAEPSASPTPSGAFRSSAPPLGSSSSATFLAP